jgi:mediator of RNA polymerase II transcription subunit 6
MFYDKQSTNQVLRMQTIHAGVSVNEEAAELRLVNDATYSLKFIFKRLSGGSLVLNLRLSTRSLRPFLSFKSVNAYLQMKVRPRASCLPHPHKTNAVRPLAAYFIMNNRIYQAPDVYTVLSNRLVSFFLPYRYSHSS